MIVRPYNDIAHVKLIFNQFAVSKKTLISMRTKMSDDENRHATLIRQSQSYVLSILKGHYLPKS